MDDRDIQQIAKIFDSIITSPSQAVHDAFRNLTVLATLAKQDEQDPGPFESMFDRIHALEQQLRELRREVQISNNGINGISPDYVLSDDIQLSFGDTMADTNWIGNITISGSSNSVYTDPSIQIFKIT